MGFSLNSFSAERAMGAPTGHTVREPGWSAHFVGGVFDGKLLESAFMRISEAARRLGTSARMLRYREDLGLLPQVRDPLAGPPWSPRGPSRGPSSGAPRGPSSGAPRGPSSGAPRGPS